MRARIKESEERLRQPDRSRIEKFRREKIDRFSHLTVQFEDETSRTVKVTADVHQIEHDSLLPYFKYNFDKPNSPSGLITKSTPQISNNNNVQPKNVFDRKNLFKIFIEEKLR